MCNELTQVAYAICAALLNGRPTSSNYFYDFTWSGTLYGPVMMEAQKYVPTLFPMIYGLELARLTKAFALYKAERGTRIGVSCFFVLFCSSKYLQKI